MFDTGSGYAVDTSLDYNAINLVYHQSVPPEHSSIDAGYLLSHILDARAETFFSAYYMAELVTAPVKSDIIRLKHFDLFRRREANANEIEQFNELVLPEFPSLREIVNSGERSFSDFLKLLDEAERFKNFIQIANPDSSLVRHYQLEATKDTWAEHLPTKSVRFLVASGLGLLADAIAPTGVGTAIGLGVGAADSFLLV